jgi:hypothetical protein
MDYTLEQLKAAFNAGRYSAENLPRADADGVFFQFLENLQRPADDAKPVIQADPESTSSTAIV